jgi:ribosomal protein L23
VLLKFLTTAKAFSLCSQANTLSFRVNFVKKESFIKIAKRNINFVKTAKIYQMARVRSTARVTREGEETEATETAPISEVMR